MGSSGEVMGDTRHIIIIGGGIVGLSCAFHARRAGCRVTLVDPQIARDRASYGNAGVLAVCDALPLATPGLLGRLPTMLCSPASPLRIRLRYLPALAPWLYRFVRASAPHRVRAAAQALHGLLDAANAAHDEIMQAAGAGDLVVPTGWLKAYESEQAYRRVERERDTLRDLGVPMQELGRADLDALAPGARGLFRHGTLYTSCRQIRDPGEYVDRLQNACRNLGVAFVAGRATGFALREGSPAGVVLQDRSIAGDGFVVAAGAWSRPLAARLGCDVPLDTERGYHVMVSHDGEPLLHAPTLWAEQSIVMSQLGSGVRITSSVEFAGLRAPPRYDAIERILGRVRLAMPGLAGPVQGRWLGFRPSMPDSLPVIGRTPRHRNCWLAFGHGHLGLTLGPITGKLLARQLAGLPPAADLEPFTPGRF